MSAQNINIKCPSCQTVYSVPAGKIGEKGRKIRCSVCNHRFVVRLSAPKPKPTPVPAAAAVAEKPAPTFPQMAGGSDVSNDTPFDTPAALDVSETTHIPSLHESLEAEGASLEVPELPSAPEPGPQPEPAREPLGDVNPFQEDLADESASAADAFEALLGGEGTAAEEHSEFAFDEPEPEEETTPLSSINEADSLATGIHDDVSFGDIDTDMALESDDSLSALSSMQESDTDVTGAFLSSDFDDDTEVAEDSSEGTVEFFVEDKEGRVNRIDTVASDDPLNEEIDISDENPSEAEMARRRAILAAKVEALETKDDVVGTKRYEMKGETPIYMERTETGSKIEMPQFSSDVPDDEDDEEVSSKEIELPSVDDADDSGERWVNPMKAGGTKSSLLVSESEAAPSSGALYNVILIVLGLAGIATNMIDIGGWKFDMIWSLVMAGMGAAGFVMQNFSGVYIAGFFSLFYSFGVFSHQLPLVAENRLEGVKHISVFLLIALIFLGTYFLLMGRKKGTPIVKEGAGQAIAAVGFGAAALIITLLNAFLNLGTAIGLNLMVYYGGIDLSTIFSVALVAGAMAAGLSAVKVHNNQLNLAYAGFGLGFVSLLVLFFTGTF